MGTSTSYRAEGGGDQCSLGGSLQRWSTHQLRSAVHLAGVHTTGAVSRLSELTRATNEEVSMNAQAALTWIGNAGLPTFIEAVTNGSSTKSLRVSAITEIGMVQKRHTNADSALSLLLGCLRDNDPEIAAAAARAAGEFGTQADTAVPALTLAAQGSNAVVPKSLVT